MKKVKLIINGDDFGQSIETNLAIIEAFDNKLISSTTILSNMNGFEDAVKSIHKYNLNNKVGIHLNISEGRPLTNDIRKYRRFCDENGNFIKRRYSARQFLRVLNQKEYLALKSELNAQIYKCRDNGLILTHADSHHHKHIELYMLSLLKEILRENNVMRMRLARTITDNKLSLKFLYRNIYNSYIKKSSNIITVNYFIAFGDIEKIQNVYNDEFIEIMCHPSIENGLVMEGNDKLRDLIYILREKFDFEMVSYADI